MTQKWTRVVTAALMAVTIVALTPIPASAEGGGSSSSSVVGRGDILTTITSKLPRVRTGSQPRNRPRCRTVVLNDAEIEFLIALISLYPDAEGSKELAQLLRDYMISPEPPVDHPTDQDPPSVGAATRDQQAPGPPTSTPAAPGPPSPDISTPPTAPPRIEYEILLRICGGVAADIWASPRVNPGNGSSTTVGRSMITRLPEPLPTQSPPLGVPVPINQPVFVSVPASLWTPVGATLRLQGTVAEVRAEPVTLRVYSGDGSAQIRTCPGRGVAFDLLSRISPARQSLNPAACTVTYVHRTDRPGVDGQARSFIGAVTVLWSAEWRTDGGPWRSLGLIPRTRVFERSVREVRTAISTAAPGRHSK